MLSRFLLPLLVFLAALMSSATAIAAPADQAEPSELRALLSAGQDTNPDFDASGPTPQRSAVIDEPVAQVKPETPQIGRAHVCTPVTNSHLVCRISLEKKKL